MQKKILIVDKVHPVLAEMLTQNGFVCETRLAIDHDEFILLEDSYIGLVIRSKFLLDEAALSSKQHLKFIVRIGSGLENIDVDFAEKQGVICLRTPEGNAPAVAEHCLGLLFCALKNIPNLNDEIKNGIWIRDKNKGNELSSRTIGIIGYGHTGKAFAHLLKNMSCRILAHDKFYTDFADSYVEEVSLDNLLQQADVISIHINYMAENHHFVNRNFIDKIKNPAILINTSRGQVVDTEAVLYGLKENKITYACLDVLEYENIHLMIPKMADWKTPMQELAASKQTILTPHIAGITLQSERKHAEIALNKILDFWHGF